MLKTNKKRICLEFAKLQRKLLPPEGLSFPTSQVNKIIICVYRALYVFISVPPRILMQAVGLGSWMLLLAKAGFTSVVALISLQMYLSIPSQGTNSYY